MSWNEWWALATGWNAMLVLMGFVNGQPWPARAIAGFSFGMSITMWLLPKWRRGRDKPPAWE